MIPLAWPLEGLVSFSPGTHHPRTEWDGFVSIDPPHDAPETNANPGHGDPMRDRGPLGKANTDTPTAGRSGGSQKHDLGAELSVDG